MSRFADQPNPPYYAVVFTNQRRDASPDDGYGEMADQMGELAQTMPGYLGIETTRDAEGFGITVSYWQDEASILNWKQQSRHLIAQKMGHDRWYSHFILRVAKVERSYSGPDA